MTFVKKLEAVAAWSLLSFAICPSFTAICPGTMTHKMEDYCHSRQESAQSRSSPHFWPTQQLPLSQPEVRHCAALVITIIDSFD